MFLLVEQDIFLLLSMIFLVLCGFSCCLIKQRFFMFMAFISMVERQFYQNLFKVTVTLNLSFT